MPDEKQEAMRNIIPKKSELKAKSWVPDEEDEVVPKKIPLKYQLKLEKIQAWTKALRKEFIEAQERLLRMTRSQEIQMHSQKDKKYLPKKIN